MSNRKCDDYRHEVVDNANESMMLKGRLKKRGVTTLNASEFRTDTLEGLSTVNSI